MLRLLAALLALAGPTIARAALIRAEFESVVTAVRDDFGLLPGVEVGSVVSGSLILDDGVDPQANPSATAWFYFFSEVPEAGFRFSVEGLEFELLNSASLQRPLQVLQDTGGYIASRRRFFGDLPQSDDGTLTLDDAFFAILWGDVAPPLPSPFPRVDLDGVSETLFSFVARSEDMVHYLDNTRSLFLSELTAFHVVPEPTALALLGVALAAGFALRRQG